MKEIKDYYANGLKIENELVVNLKGQQKRIEGNKASLLIIDGAVGEGKTTLAIHCADLLNKKEIDFSKQLAMGGKDFLCKLKKCYKEKLGVIIYDEAGDFNRRGALTRFNAMLNRTFETYRAFKIIVILVLPNFAVLDKDIFDKKIPRLLLHCYGRNDNYGLINVYSLYRMMYIKEKMRKLVVKPMAYKFTRPNHHGRFKDLNKKRSKELDKITTKGKISELQDAEVKIQGLVCYTDMIARLSCSIATVKNYVKKLGIKPEKYINKRAYYKESVIDSIANLMDEVQANMGEKMRGNKYAKK